MDSITHHLHKHLVAERSRRDPSANAGDTEEDVAPPPPYTHTHMPSKLSQTELSSIGARRDFNTITIDATTTVSGSDNIVSLDAAMIGARLAGALVHMLRPHTSPGGGEYSRSAHGTGDQGSCSDAHSAEDEEEDSDDEPVDVRLSCSVRIDGDRNFVGHGHGLVAAAKGPALQHHPMPAATAAGAKRKAGEDASDGNAKKSKVEP